MRFFPLCLIAFPLLVSAALADAKSAAPAAPVAAAGATPAVEEPGKIEGLTIPRANGRFIGIEMVDLQMRVTFYDAKKKPEAADVIRIAARWKKPKKQERAHTVLTPDAPERLVSPAVFRPPHVYNVSLVLIGADEKMVEQYVVNLGSGQITVGAVEGAEADASPAETE